MPARLTNGAILKIAAIFSIVASLAWWIWYYTHWVAIGASLFVAMGAVAALIFSLLAEDDQTQVQHTMIDLLTKGRGGLAVTGALVFLCLALSFIGRSVSISPASDNKVRVLRTGKWDYQGNFSWDSHNRGPVGTSKQRFFLLNPMGPKQFRLKLSGLPALESAPAVFRRKPHHVPEDFLDRPVLLIMPSVALVLAKDAGFKIHVAVDGVDDSYEIDFRGRAVWLGCERDVAIPREVLRKWEVEYFLSTRNDENKLPDHIGEMLLPPDAIAPDLRLEPGQRILVTLKKSKSEMTEKWIPEDYDRDRFPLTLKLRIPE